MEKDNQWKYTLFQENFRALRVIAGLDTVEFGGLFGTTRQTINSIERLQTQFKRKHFVLYINHLAVYAVDTKNDILGSAIHAILLECMKDQNDINRQEILWRDITVISALIQFHPPFGEIKESASRMGIDILNLPTLTSSEIREMFKVILK